MNIKSIHAKQFLLPLAIKHYMENNTLYHILTLWNDDEPYPIEEVIYLQEAKLQAVKNEIKQVTLPNEPDDPMDKKAKEYYIARDKLRFLTKQADKMKLVLDRLKHRKQAIK